MKCGLIHVGFGLLLVSQEGLNFSTQIAITATGAIEKGFPFTLWKRQCFAVNRFDLLYAIYEEEGYAPSDIPGLILTHNLYGTEIDSPGRPGVCTGRRRACVACSKL